MATYNNISKQTASGLDRWATADELCAAIGIKDRRCLNKWGIRRMRFSSKCVRYHVGDFIQKIEARTVHKEKTRRRTRKSSRHAHQKLTNAKQVAERRYQDLALPDSPSFNAVTMALI